MSNQTKFLQIKNSIKYRTVQPLKFYLFKTKYNSDRESALKELIQDPDVRVINKNTLSLLGNDYLKDYKETERKTLKKYEEIKNDLGLGLHGVHYPDFLYYIIRQIQPKQVLETGVWLGLSTNIILSAGSSYLDDFSLDSIDLPRFDMKESEKFQGLLVEERFQNNWNLYTGKDRKYLKRLILEKGHSFFYFDSDKSLNGKLFLFNTVKKETNDYFIIFDDIEDNYFWYSKEIAKENKILIRYEKKFFGIIYTDNYKLYLNDIHGI